MNVHAKDCSDGDARESRDPPNKRSPITLLPLDRSLFWGNLMSLGLFHLFSYEIDLTGRSAITVHRVVFSSLSVIITPYYRTKTFASEVILLGNQGSSEKIVPIGPDLPLNSEETALFIL